MKFIYTFFGVILITNIFAQPTFNKKYYLKYNVAIFSNLDILKNNLYISGFMTIEKPYTDAGFFTKLDLNGDTIFTSTLKDSLRTVLWQNNMKLTLDHNYILHGGIAGKSRITLVDTFGNILRDKLFYSAFASTNTDTYSKNIYQDSDSIIWLISIVRKSSTQDFIQINKFSRILDSLDQKIISTNGLAKSPKYFNKLTSNKYLIAGSYSTEPYVWSNFQIGDFFIVIDSSCNIIEEYNVPSNLKLGGMGDLIYNEIDSSFVACGIKCYEFIDNSGFGYVYYYPLIYKYDKNKNIIWKTNLGDGKYSESNSLSRIRLSIEGDGYVFIGQLFNSKSNSFGGILGKVSLNGDSLWLRKYRYFNDTSYILSNFYEIQPAPDGGYYLSGSTIGGPKPEDNYTGGWLLKVDKFGCLVPGCEQPDAFPTLSQNEIHYKVFPNPTQNELYVFMDETNGKEIGIKICDINGILLKSISHYGAATSYTLSLNSYSAGVYFIQFWENNKLVKTEQFVKQ